MTPIDKLVANIEQSDFPTLMQAGGPQLRALLDLATTLFEDFDVGTQTMALSLMFGMLLGSIEGLPVEMEHTEKVIVTFEDRIRMFNAQVLVAFKAAYAEAKDAPGSPRMM